MEGDCHSLAQRALDLEKLCPPVRHDPAQCEVCAEYQREYLGFARGALPELARAYLDAEEQATKTRHSAAAQRQFLREIHAEWDALQRELDARALKIENLKNALDVREAHLRHAPDLHASKPGDLQRELDQRASRIQELERDFSVREAEARALQRQAEDLNGRIRDLESELLPLSAARDTENQALKQELDAHAARIELLQHDAGAHAAWEEALNRELGALTATLQAQLQGAAVRDAEIEALQEELHASEIRSAGLENEARRIVAARDAQAQELNARAARLEVLQGELKDGAMRLEELRVRVAEREAESEALKQDLVSSVSRVAELEKELQQGSSARDSEADALQRELDSRTSIAEALQRDLEARAQRIEKLERDLSARASDENALNEALHASATRSAGLEDEAQRIVAARDAQVQELNARAARLEVLQGELKDGAMRLEELRVRVAEREAESEALKQELVASVSRVAELEKELQQGSSARDSEADALQRELDSRASIAEALQRDLEARAQRIEELERDLGRRASEEGAIRESSKDSREAFTQSTAGRHEEVHSRDAQTDTIEMDSSGVKPISGADKPWLNGQSADSEADRGGHEHGYERDASVGPDIQEDAAKEQSRSPVVLMPARSRSRLADIRGPGAMPDPVLTFSQATPHEEPDPLSLHQLVGTVRRNRWLVIGVGLATIASAAAYNRLADPVYQSSATIRVDDKDANSMLTGVAAVPGLSGSKIQTEMEVLRSSQLAEKVATKLHLNLEVLEPSAARRLIRVVEMPSDVAPSEFMLTLKGAGSYEVQQEGDGPRVGFPAEVQVGVPFSVAGAKLILERPASGPLPPRVEFRFRPLRRSVEAIRKALTVSRPQREAQIINVRYESTDAVTAAAVPNLLLAEFIRYKAQTSKTEATSTVGFLRQQVASYEGQLRAAESALGGFREQAQIVSIADEAQTEVRRMAEMQAERDQLQSERQSLASILAKAPVSGESFARDIAAFPSFITNRAMQDILQSLIQLENERSQLLLRRNPENADVVALTGRIGELERQLSQMARAYLAGIDSKLASVNSNVQSFGRRIETIPAKEIAFARLSRDQKLLGDISTLLQTRLKEAEIKEAIQPGDVRGIDRAPVPDRATSPKSARNILFGGIGGILLGIVAALARERLDTKVRTKEDVQSVTGGIPILGAIPRIPTNGQARPAGRTAGKVSTEVAAATASNGNRLITQLSSRDVFAESYRALRTNITFAAADHPNQVMVLTSALAGDGKSTTASNLAVTLAQQGVRTLLIDADLRKGILHKIFAVGREPGLTQLLIGESSVDAAVQMVSLGEGGQTLHLITSGRLPPNPAELLGSERMRKLLEQLRQRFDMIIFDTPPLTLVTDAAVLGTLADSAVLVARAGVTDKRALQHAAAQLYHLRVQVSGTIVNDFDPKETGYGYEYGYGYAPGYGRGYAYGAPR